MFYCIIKIFFYFNISDDNHKFYLTLLVDNSSRCSQTFTFRQKFAPCRFVNFYIVHLRLARIAFSLQSKSPRNRISHRDFLHRVRANSTARFSARKLFFNLLETKQDETSVDTLLGRVSSTIVCELRGQE